MKIAISLLLPLALVSVATSAGAAEKPAATSTVSFETELGVVSDYRYRGLSLSDAAAALQGGLTASVSGGAYGYVGGSTIEEYGAGPDGKGARFEVDLVAGWTGELGGLDVDASAQLYAYPGATNVNYVEFPISVSRALGDWRWSLGGAYAPSQKALEHRDNAYGWAGIAWEGAPLQLELRAGYEDGAYAPHGKWDWSLAASRAFGPLTGGLAYVDSDDPKSSAAVVASLVATF